ncbi:bifunctional phosphopantothenoylcysteine decarboxylase/phosphopantothenate--cysteine ligase CoaBC [Mycoplasmopsis columboralis]|uniref:Coenzyme A biosynthesis bifunctional protein CoaBC n=1 Tax=Mycoplasmopsis columboralis TaxID=171282 RepID=A0A449B723_9BACT|nr:bifunctional phosphopantothenoylcysteine decarboxylase/phosphopantothenate--cysteine ligase CoaBC [Mycoplasmopsis columboralis]VEU76386.1 DNA/pantothenate metabolism flavoprotein [Mycoplasmopsis columboralis]
MKILLLITGSVASIKAKKLYDLLIRNNHEVRVAISESAHNFVPKHIFENSLEFKWYENATSVHIEAPKWADRIIVYPASFNTIGKVSNAIADNFITSVMSVAPFDKTIFCPAMNTKMYHNPFLQANIVKLKQQGAIFLGPAKGLLKDGEIGIGRVVEPQAVIDFLENKNPKKILLTFGYTQVKLDPVRSVAVHSSGKSGLALIQTLSEGYDVTVINGNLPHLNEYIPSHVKVVNISSVNEYYKAVDEHIVNNDCFISLCAVSDLIFESQEHKIKKNAPVDFKYQIGRDVLKDISHRYPQKLKVGYALETNDILDNGLKKLTSKNLNMIVINDSSSLANNTSSGYIVVKDNSPLEFKNLNKHELAQQIKDVLDKIWID